jgi:hypothetical protein
MRCLSRRNGIGTSAAPKLIGVGDKFDAAKLEALLRSPTEKMTGGMQPVEINEGKMKLLIEYIQSLR